MPDAHAAEPAPADDASPDDGRVDDARTADRLAIEDLATAYAHAVDDRDWIRWEALFLPDALVDYRSAGGIAGTPAEVAAWMPGAFEAFTWCLHSMSTHEVRFTGADTARGRLHVHNRNGITWDGRAEEMEVGAVYHDRYVRTGGRWRFAQRVEHTMFIRGGRFAAMVAEAAGLPGPGDGAGQPGDGAGQPGEDRRRATS